MALVSYDNIHSSHFSSMRYVYRLLHNTMEDSVKKLKSYFAILLFAFAAFGSSAIAHPFCLGVLEDCYNSGHDDAYCSGNYYGCLAGFRG